MEQAAVELYAQRGPSGPTAAEIAARAGVTERTFFRHFSDKLDAFFGDELRLRGQLAVAISRAPSELSPLLVAMTGLRDLSMTFTEQREAILRRAEIVASHPQLREREFGRSFGWATVIAEALIERGVGRGAAREAALVALAAFRAAYEEWTERGGEGRLEDRLEATVARLAADLREF
jgi:AcrR family transcriptional regulator